MLTIDKEVGGKGWEKSVLDKGKLRYKGPEAEGKMTIWKVLEKSHCIQFILNKNKGGVQEKFRWDFNCPLDHTIT